MPDDTYPEISQIEKYKIRGAQNHERHMTLLKAFRDCFVEAIAHNKLNVVTMVADELISADKQIFDHIYGRYMK